MSHERVAEGLHAVFEQYPTTADYELLARHNILYWLSGDVSGEYLISAILSGGSRAGRNCGVPIDVLQTAVRLLVT